MHHPLSKEKKILKVIANRIGLLKLKLKVKHQFPNIDSRTMPKLQQTLNRLQRSYRHRHIAYCLVRRGERSIERFSIGHGIETRYTHEKPNMKLVNMHRMRLLTEIAQAYSDYTDELIKQIPRTFRYDERKNFIEESAPIDEKTWKKLSNFMTIGDMTPPLCEYITQTGKRVTLDIRDFEQDSKGDFIYTITEEGNIYFRDGRESKVYEDCTLEMIPTSPKPEPPKLLKANWTEEVKRDIEGGWKTAFMPKKCPYFAGLSEDNDDECSLGGLCTEKYPNCKHYLNEKDGV